METTPPTREDREKSKSASSEKAARIKRLAASIGKNSHDDTKEFPFDKADISDILAILDRLLSQAGPSGLSSETREAIDKMPERWAKDDFESALHRAKTHPILFLFFPTNLFESWAKTDPSAAFDFYITQGELGCYSRNDR